MDEVRLIMFKTDGTRRDFPLRKRNVVIGRTNEVDLRIPLSSVSRRHCEVYLEGDAVKLRDLGSSNGTFHNNVRVTEATLAAGDQIEVGPVVFILTVNGKPENVAPVRSMMESDPVDTGAGIPAIDSPTTPPPPSKVIKPVEKAAVIPPVDNDQDLVRVEPEMDSPTVDLDDPISALERLSREQRKAEDVSFFEDEKPRSGAGKERKS
ncbi:MAG: FHA domain-containing protein [Phycisphaeraceae bacterium]